ncbi:uncharacterized protein MEPE_00229 [Melanopsichium pennsylvanicum]|uniref:Uncharacterized protein n=1 Tax=Melanopsichium pennsylvanicum TaxID=63383 RepID=A0AAJ5C2K7_9BASI|nr:uncharacterized protein MEPE_00229 [Melanopsichium pennsylvanicum]
MSGKANANKGAGGGNHPKGPAQPSRAEAMNPNNLAYNPRNPAADRAAAFNPQHHAYNPTTETGKK